MMTPVSIAHGFLSSLAASLAPWQAHKTTCPVCRSWANPEANEGQPCAKGLAIIHDLLDLLT